ncbi:peroxisomal acyl-coenzyme A oxidase 2 isoform X3 [Rana temporaria]|uniref:peroxisomal acyl-coenzyme A oxidase 2 isoform X3 n=1 Tax=Rana temporaria TaxID=8407 RepID=UPI001AAD2C13|nr:peroxisomal acyl-coenzyme A oxidase 2 isoform X3 [Rana temporaria]
MAWWKVSAAGKDVNPDLASERLSPSFNVETLTNLLDGGAEETQRRRSVVVTIQKDPVFSLENLYFQTPPERYEGSVRNIFHLKKKMKELGWEDNGREKEYALRALSDEFSLKTHGVFTQSLTALGTDEQIAKWLPLANNYQILGTYAQTELGHGTYLRGLETTSTFDPTTQEFIIDTPTITATKWWPGGLGKTSTHALVLAQLRSNGKNYGMHPFIVPIRSLKDHSPLPGITVGDIGPKMGLQQVDNGYLMMRNIRIPKENMLSRFSEVLPDGSYVKHGSDKLNYFAMVGLRVSIAGNAVDSLKKACTISVRYSAVRRQSELKPGAQEAKILDYQTQQQKLLPLLATCYSIHFMAIQTTAFYNEAFKEIRMGNFNSLAEIHAIASGLKGFATEICSNGVEVCRKACGGHGYSLFSGIPTIYTWVVASCTYEGENTILHLQAARFLIKCFGAAQSGKPLPPRTTSYLSKPPSSGCQANTHLDFLNPDVYIKAYESRAYSLIAAAASKLHCLVQSGTEQYVAWNSTSVELVKASIGHIHYLIVKTFASALSSLSTQPEIKTVLQRLCDLYALHGIFTSAGDFLQHGYLSGKQLDLATTAYLGLLADLRKDAVLLVDAFDYTDQQLISALGTYDGNVYQNLLDWVQRNPENKKVSPVFEKYLKPYLQSNQSKL